MRTVDEAVRQELQKVSPLNPYGEPMFRAMWSADRTHWACGWWSDYDSTSGVLIRKVFEPRICPKYHFTPRWIIERWRPPEWYGTLQSWNEKLKEFKDKSGMESLLELGPYPARGDFELSWICQMPVTHEFIELTSPLAAGAVFFALKPPLTREQIEEQQAIRFAAERKVLEDFVDEACDLPFDGKVTNLSPLSIQQLIRQHTERSST